MPTPGGKVDNTRDRDTGDQSPIIVGFSWPIRVLAGFAVGIQLAILILTLVNVQFIQDQIMASRVGLGKDHAVLGEKLNAMHSDFQAAAAEIRQLRGELRLMRMRVSSLTGKCDPEVNRLVVEAWNKSRKVLTLRETQNLVWVESRCDPFATDGKCYGLMQVNPDLVAPGMSKQEAIEQLTDPEANLAAGMSYLAVLADQYQGDKVKILTAWQWGPTRMRNGITTGEFARKVLR